MIPLVQKVAACPAGIYKLPLDLVQECVETYALEEVQEGKYREGLQRCTLIQIDLSKDSWGVGYVVWPPL